MAATGRLLNSASGLMAVLVCLALAACAARRESAPPPRPAASSAALRSAPQPPGFEPNRGQWPAPVRFMARDGAATLYLTEREAVWRQRDGARDHVRLRWMGANPSPDVHADGERRTRVNYVGGRHPDAWHNDIPLFARVTYREIYPAIDLVFHDARGGLEYDFFVAPGADPDAIRLRADGAAETTVDALGRLILRLDGGAVVHQAPLAFQETPDGHRIVPAAYRLVDDDSDGGPAIAFALGAYDRSRALTIDPSVAYLTEVDDGTDSVVDIAADAEGNLWIVGTTPNDEFPVTDDAVQSEVPSSDGGYVVKLDAAGELVYATYFGGRFASCMGGVDVDAVGNAYLTGATLSEDLPITNNALQPTAPGGQGDSFLTKLGPDGQLLYSTYFGGTGQESGCNGGRIGRNARVRVAADGSILLLIGSTVSLELPGSPETRSRPDSDAYLARLSPEFVLAWGRFLGGSEYDIGYDLELDASGNAYVYGITSHSLGAPQNFPTTAGAFQEHNDLDNSHFIARYAPDGNLLAATLLGPTSGGDDGIAPGGLAVAPDDSVFLVVPTASAMMPITPGALQATLSGFSDFYVAALDPTLATLRHATYLGGSQSEQHTGGGLIADLDDAGDLYVGGQTQSLDYPMQDALPGVASDVVVSKLDPELSEVRFSSFVPLGTFALTARAGALYVAGQLPNRPAVGAVKIDPASSPACRGDCDGDGSVLVNELVTGVRIALGQEVVSACTPLDSDGDGSVVIAELIGAVGSLLQGCG